MAIFEIKDLNFQFKNNDSFCLKNINLQIEKGEFISLIGKSGSGKTTLLKMLKKELTPAGIKSGNIYYNGVALDNLANRESVSEIGYIFQNPENQIVTDKVWHEIAFGLENLGIEPNEMRLRIGEIVNYFGLQNIFYADTDKLSGGQKQLVNLSAVLAMHPKVLIFDEPLAQLDPLTAEEFINVIKKVNEEFGITVIMCEHRLDLIFGISDKIAYLENGEIKAFDTPNNVAKFIDNYDNIYFSTLPVTAMLNVKYDIDKTIFPSIKKTRIWLENIIGEKEQSTQANEEKLNKTKFIKKSKDISSIVYKNTEDVYNNNKNIKDANNGNENTDDVYNNNKNIKDANNVNKNTDVVYNNNKNINNVNENIKDVNENILSFKNIYFRYEYGGIDVLKDLSFNLEKNAISALLGGNGAGKSTLVKLLLGNKPYSGKIKINGEKLKKQKDLSKLIGVLPQNLSSFFIYDTVQELLYKAPTDLNLFEVEKIVRDFELKDLLTHNPLDLSGGEQQRVGLARLLIKNAKVIVLDEPTKGLDGIFKDKLGELLKELKAKNYTILIISHDIEFCAKYCDYCNLLFDGKIVSHASAIEFFYSNNFYTTLVNKIARNIRKDIVLTKDLLLFCDKYTK